MSRDFDLRYVRAESGFCRVVYKSRKGFFYCLQQDDKDGPFVLYACTRDGEPEARAPLERFPDIEPPRGSSSTEVDLIRWLLRG